MADGTGVIVAILDSGISLNRRVFRRENGESKVISVWDQTVAYDSESAPNRYGLGRIYNSDEINEAVNSAGGGTFPGSISGSGVGSPVGGSISSIARDVSGHGTRVAGIVTENAPGADLLIVKLSGGNREGFAKTTSIMFAVDYCVNFARELGRPCVINLSYGNNNGGHDGRQILETYLNHVAESYIVSIVVATGNEGDRAHHKEIRLEADPGFGTVGAGSGVTGIQRAPGSTTGGTGVDGRRAGMGNELPVEILMGENERDLTVTVWLSFQDRCQVRLESPAGESFTVMPGFDLATLENVRVAVFYGDPTPLNMSREIRFRWLDAAVPSGIWRLVFVPEEIRWGRVNMWLPVTEGLAGDTRFVEPTLDISLTIPSTADGVISVGAFDDNRNTLASFSGRGFTRDDRIKPDVVAPGVDVETIAPVGTSLSTGTSFATPYISARAAVLMDWGIVQGNDPFLYGEKLKAYIIREAQPLPVLREYPNPEVGWGAVR